MHSDGDEVHVSEEEASGGSKEGVVRWVLIIGTLLAIITLSTIWITGAALRDDPDADYASVDAKIAATEDAADPSGAVPDAPTDAAAQDQTTVEDGVPVIKN